MLAEGAAAEPSASLQLVEPPNDAVAAATRQDNALAANEEGVPAEDASGAVDLAGPGDVSAYAELGALGPRPEEAHGLSAARLRDLLGDPVPAQDAVCQGPWLSRAFDCFRMATDAACGVLTEQIDEELVEYNGCARPEFGLMDMVQSHEMAITEALQTIHDGNVCKKYGRALDQGKPLKRATEQCSEHYTRAIRAQAGQSDWTASCTQVRRMAENLRPLGKSCHHGGLKSYVLWSAVVRVMRPVYNHRAQDPACGRKTPIVMRRLQERSYQTCRHPQFGREASNVCSAPEEVLLSAPGTRRGQFALELQQTGRAQGVTPPRCITCDDLPLGSGAQVADRWACIRQGVADVAPLVQATEGFDMAAHADVQALHDGLLSRGRALFESMDSPWPTAAEAASMYSAPLAAAGAVAAVDAQDQERWSARLQLCEALLQSHVDPRRIEHAYQYCLELSSESWSVHGHLAPGAEHRRRATRLGMSLFGRYLRGMQQSGHLGEEQQSALREAAFGMAHRWFVHARANPFLSHVPVSELRRVHRLMQDGADAGSELSADEAAGR